MTVYSDSHCSRWNSNAPLVFFWWFSFTILFLMPFMLTCSMMMFSLALLCCECFGNGMCSFD